MSDNNNTYRIKTNVGSPEESFINVKLDQDYDTFEILSLKLKGSDTYRLHNADYGVIVGRVLANENFGVPNAKVSVFIEADTENMSLSELEIYPYTRTSTTNSKGIRYNLLPNEKIADCHQPVGSFPTKSYLLDNDDLIEIFDGYYVYTTRTNNAGDYMICGVPTGNHELHMDLDLSDCGILSQRPRDFVYKGYTMEQFENPNMFKTGTTLSSLSQIFSQNQSVNVIPFWGNDVDGEEIGITRADIFISFTFEPTCVFMGSVVTDNTSNGISKKCVPTNNMGAMDELTTGKGTIEIIRKTPGGNIEQIEVKGDQVIDGNGVWCYQIPMNLDYMMTDEYGNMVPTDDPNKGIPTRTRVRFRVSLENFGENTDNYFKSKALVPNNPDISKHGDIDYNFGSETQDESFRDLYWNNVYTIKSYIPRFQKSKNWRSERFSGIKHCNIYGNNNPMPYNNIRVRLPLMFRIMCAILKNFIRMTYLLNKFIYALCFRLTKFLGRLLNHERTLKLSKSFRYILIGEKLCEDLDGWYFVPGGNTKYTREKDKVDVEIGGNWANTNDDFFLLQHTYDTMMDKQEMEGFDDNTSVDTQNKEDANNEGICMTTDTDYLVSCLEMQLAQEYKVIQFDFYNDWINGTIYLPNWKRIVKTKRTFMFWTWNRKKIKIKGCMNANGTGTAKTRYLVQQCALQYKGKDNVPFTEITSTIGCSDRLNGRILGKKVSQKLGNVTIQEQKCHKATGMKRVAIFGRKNGVVTEVKTSRNQYVYYLKPCEWGGKANNGTRVLLFATDVVLLGSLNDCDDNGIPQAFKHLNSSSFKMPTNLALTTIDDDSFIFTTTGATICKKSSETNDMTTGNGGLRRQYTTYDGTNKAYSVNMPSEQIKYENNDDPIAVTEAAGISWNYTGPGQDILGIKEQGQTLFPNINPIDSITDDLMKQKYMYYPGGHFLGLSCNNSQTNIKSCINLQRICEVGTTMSERHEIVRGYDGDKHDFKYRYLVPTGFIAQDEINDARFRTMFATLNHNKLLATGVDEKTGYPAYKFKFMRPNGFDGTFSKYTYMNRTPYNHTAPDVVDETSVMSKVFELNGWSAPIDYDEEESANTETRTIEDVSKDYYMFRMGLNDLKLKSQIERFLVTQGVAEGAMPQYENSFYFYFGLKDGATALDEFKRMFFSECDRRLIMSNASLKVRTEIDYCNLEGTVTLSIDGMIPQYSITIKDNKKDAIATVNGVYMEDVAEKKDVATYRLPVGIYTITVTDMRETSKSVTINLGDSEVEISDFRAINYRVSGGTTNGKDGRLGGYVVFDKEITVNDKTYTFGDSSNGFNIYIGDENYPVNYSHTVENYTDSGGVERLRIFGFEPEKDYDIYVTITCEGAAESHGKYYVDTVNLTTNKDIDMLYGCYALSYKKVLKNFPHNNWWNNLDSNSQIGNAISDYVLEQVDRSSMSFVQDVERVAKSIAWVLKMHAFRQLTNDDEGFDSKLIGYSEQGEKVLTITFGEPERYNHGYEVKKTGYSESDYEEYETYQITDTASHYPTWGIKDGDDVYHNSTEGRIEFSKMAYTQDGRAGADPLDCIVSSVTHDDSTNKNTITFNGNGLSPNEGAIVVFEDGEIVFPYMTSSTQGYYYGSAPASDNPDWLKMATVYPTFRFPVMYRPFFGTIKFLTMAYAQVELPDMSSQGASPILNYDIKPYFTGGELHNGVTFDDHLAKDPDKTTICGYGLEGIYPEDFLMPDSSGKEYKASPLSGVNWTIDDTNSAYTTYASGRTLDIKAEASLVGATALPGFPFYFNANTGDTLSYTFTEGYPNGFFESAYTTYSAITKPYYPKPVTCEDMVTPEFVDYIIFEHGLAEGTTDPAATRRLYGNIESTEYETDEGNWLRYYDVTNYGLSNMYAKQTGAKSEISRSAWVYSNYDTGKKKWPVSYIACFCKDDTSINQLGGNIVYVKAYDAGQDTLFIDVPKTVSGMTTTTPKRVGNSGSFGDLKGDLMEDLQTNHNGRGLNTLYNKLVNDCNLQPLKNPSPIKAIDMESQDFTLNFDVYVESAYTTFLRADADGKQISLSKIRQFDGSMPQEVLGVMKHTEGRNETYVFKYFIEVYDFGDGAYQQNTMGAAQSNNAVSTDVDTVPTTGSSFNVTIDSDVEWILSITSTTKDGVTISCNGIGNDMINSSWADLSTPDNTITIDKVRNIQLIPGEDDLYDAKRWDESGGYHLPAGHYVFTVNLKENKADEDLKLSIFSIPYYPEDIVNPQQVDITQHSRDFIEIIGTIESRFTDTDTRTDIRVQYNFEASGDEWPDELTLTINGVCQYNEVVSTDMNARTVVSVDLSEVGIDADDVRIFVPDGQGGGSYQDVPVTAELDTNSTEGWGRTSASNSVGAIQDVPFSITLTKNNLSGSLIILDKLAQSSNGLSETSHIVGLKLIYKGGTFTNLGDNYAGKAVVTFQDPGMPPNVVTIIQPER